MNDAAFTCAEAKRMKSFGQRAESLFISWAPYCSRSDSIAARLRGKSFMIYASRFGSHFTTILFKYLAQTIWTLFVLCRERPKLIFVMTPPVVACFPVWGYCMLSGAKFVIDTHTAALLSERWQRVLFLHRFASRRAAMTIVTNEYLKSMVESWGAKAKIVTDVPVCFPEPETVPVEGEYKMTVVSSFAYDEPTEVFFEAARRLPHVQFYMTGAYEKKLTPAVLGKKPNNVHLTGFLTESQYVGLLQASDAVIALTTRDHTMQRGAYEAIYLGKPIVTSDFEVLRKSFAKGAVHVKATVDDIARGIRRMQRDLHRYREEAEELRLEKLQRWEEVAGDLLAALGPEQSVAARPDGSAAESS